MDIKAKQGSYPSSKRDNHSSIGFFPLSIEHSYNGVGEIPHFNTNLNHTGG